MRTLLVTATLVCLPALSAQVPFEQAARDLSSADAGTRLRTVQMLRDAAYPEAAVPLARAVAEAYYARREKLGFPGLQRKEAAHV